MSKSYPITVLYMLVLCMMAACTSATQPRNTPEVDSSSAAGTASPPPGDAPTPPEPPSSAVPTPPSSIATAVPVSATLSLFYVAIGDNGLSGEQVGCEDSLVMVTEPYQGSTGQLRASLDALLTNHQKYLGQSGLYNALSLSTLHYAHGSIDDNTVTVWLTGTALSAGACDDPRIIAQLAHTATVAAGVSSAQILVNNIDIAQVLNNKK